LPAGDSVALEDFGNFVESGEPGRFPKPVGAKMIVQRNASRSLSLTGRGFSMIELVIALTVILSFLAFAVPIVQGVRENFRLRTAATSVAMAIQATRFQAIRHGYPFAIEFDPQTNSYQVYSRPTDATGFNPVGGPVPLEGAGVLAQTTRLEFRPNGMVDVTAGSLTLTLSHGGNTKSIIVSRAGRVQVQ
jgi:prepilin-type N-terminal cleavage/methylation domain-containing protein